MFTTEIKPMAFLEVKGMLARLLATENLVVEHNPTAKTACFNVSTRVMTLPIWETESEEVYNLFVSHEVGHALWTPVDFPEQLKAAKVDPCTANILEDVRIEKMIQKKFPGLRRDYALGYRELHEKNLFETKGKDINDFGFLDRLNLHFKIGASLLVPFSDEEKVLVNKISACETYQDILDLAKEIQSYVKENSEDSFPEPISASHGEPTQGTPGQGNKSIDGPGKANGNEASDSESSDGDSEESKDKQGESDTSSPKGGASSQSDSEANKANESDKSDSGASTEGEKEDPKVGQLEAETQAALDEAMERMASSLFGKGIIYLNSPTYDPKDIVWPINVVRENMNSKGVDYLLNDRKAQLKFDEFLASIKRDVNHMVQQFEMRKSAAAYARIQVNKTGVLNTAELHNYKLTEDIFLRQETTPEGKSHGMVMLLDWSGSMDSIAHDTIKQILVLVQFCRKVQIPFQVYTFTTGSVYEHDKLKEIKNQPSPRAHMVEVLNSSVKKNQLDKDIFNLFLVGLYYNQRVYNYAPNPCSLLGMGGTPLNNCLFTCKSILERFKEDTAVDKVSFVTITDGESAYLEYYNDRANHDTAYNGTVMIRGNNGSVFRLDDDNWRTPGSIAKWITETLPYVSASNIYLGSMGSCKTYHNRVRGHQLHECATKLTDAFKTDKSYHFTTDDNWPLVVLLDPKVFGETVDEIQVDAGASAAKIKSAFKKFVSNKGNSKKVLSALVDSFA